MIRIASASVSFVEQRFAVPLKLSSGLIEVITEARVEVVTVVDGKPSVGRGSIYLSDLWAWPEEALPHRARDRVLRAFCTDIAARLPAACGEAMHPLESGLRLHDWAYAAEIDRADRPVPALARAVCASPFDAAIHDGVGQALGLSAFSLYAEDAPVPSADDLFAGGSATAAVRALLRPPETALPGWYIVTGDPADAGAGLARAVAEQGFFCFKLKTMGKDPDADAKLTARIYRSAVDAGTASPRLTVDSNQAYADAGEVVAYLDALEALDAGAYAALSYLEQPTHGDILAHPQDWRPVAARKPVLLDEGLTGIDVLPVAGDQGWSGLALKTCKGHSFALVAAAWAKKHGMIISLQDLTNPGLSGIHAALFAAHVPTFNGIELNAMQFTPDANAEWLPRLSALFRVKDGVHRVADPFCPGLGSHL